MSTYRDPAASGDVYPSEEEIDPTDVGYQPAAGDGTALSGGGNPAADLGAAPDSGTMVDPRVVPATVAAGRVIGPPHGSAPGAMARAASVSSAGSRSIVTHHADGSTEVVTDLDGDGVADIVQIDLDGDGVPDVTYLDADHDGRLDTVLGADGAPRLSR